MSASVEHGLRELLQRCGVRVGDVLVCPRMDVLELRVPFLPLAHRLQPVAQAVQQPAYGGRTHAPRLCGQRRGQRRAALARPAQRRCRVPARERVHQRFEGRQNPGLLLLNPRSSRARSPNPTRRFLTPRYLAASLPDGLPSQTRGRRNQRVATIPNRQRFRRRPPPTALVQHRRYRGVPRNNRRFQLQVALHEPSVTGTPGDSKLDDLE